MRPFIRTLAALALLFPAIAAAQTPMPIPHLFAPLSGNVPASYLDADFAASARTDLSNLTSPATARKYLGVAKVTTLEAIAVANNLTLGKADDGDVVTAANTAILAAEHAGGLAVQLPNGIENSSVHWGLANYGGYYGASPGCCIISDVRSTGDATSNWYVTLLDQYATSAVFSNVIVYGGGQGYGSTCPGAWLGNQNGVQFNNANAGTNDALYVSNSGVGSQLPHHSIAHIGVYGFCGTAFQTTGAGGSEFIDIKVQNNQTGFDIQGYDNKYVAIDDGGNLGIGLWCHNACGNNKFNAVKVWFSGTSLVAGQTASVYLGPFAGKNTFDGLEIQDAACEGLLIDSSSGNKFSLVVELQQLGRSTATCPQQSAIATYGSDHNEYDVLAIVPSTIAADSFPAFSPIVFDGQGLQPYSYQYSTYNTFNILATGLPGNNYVYNPWQIIGPLDTTNVVTMNGFARQTRGLAVDPSNGQVNYGISSATGFFGGVLVNGTTGPFPGQVSAIVPPNGRGQLVAVSATGASATQTFTASTNFANNDTVAIGGVSYTFVNTLTCTACNVPVGGGGTLVYQVKIGSTLAATLINMQNAINAARSSYQAGYISGTTLTTVQQQQGQAGLILEGDLVTGCVVQGSGQPCSSAVSGFVSAGTIVTAVCNPCTGSYQSGYPGAYTVNNSQTVGASNNLAFLTFQHGVMGTDYSWGTPPHPLVTAAAGSTTLVVTSITPGTGGNSIATTKSSAAGSWGAATLTGGTAGTTTYNQPIAWDQNGAEFPMAMTGASYATDAAACAAHVQPGKTYRYNSGTQTFLMLNSSAGPC